MSLTQSWTRNPCSGVGPGRLAECILLAALFLAGACVGGPALAQEVPAPPQPLPADAVKGEQAPDRFKVRIPQDRRERPGTGANAPGQPGQSGHDRPGHDTPKPKKVYVPVPAGKAGRPAAQPTPQAGGDSIVITRDPDTGDRIMMTRPVPIEQPRQEMPYGSVIVNPETGRHK